MAKALGVVSGSLGPHLQRGAHGAGAGRASGERQVLRPQPGCPPSTGQRPKAVLDLVGGGLIVRRQYLIKSREITGEMTHPETLSTHVAQAAVSTCLSLTWAGAHQGSLH